MKVLVTGGAGYIGSHTCVELLNAGHEVFVIDNLCNGYEAALERVRGITSQDLQFMNADINDTFEIDKIFNNFKPEAVIHFAGLKAVSESVSNPLKYYDVNVGGTISLLAAMTRAKCTSIVFSSSATVYGTPQYLPYDEMHPTNPINPYGRTKLIVEGIIRDWVAVNHERSATVLRYFNPVGAHQSGRIGEEPRGIPNNLMPYIAQVAVGRRDFLKIYGKDYQTIDGTASRDYIHIMDLANAHVKALVRSIDSKSLEIFNIGRGEGVTVLELVKAFEKVSGVTIKYKYEACRQGDLPTFWADSSCANKILNWQPSLDVVEMCKDTWRWQNNNLNGYEL
jgi:UDP-glucose 4-epimerase